MASITQVALCTANMPRTIRSFVEVLGYSSAGGRARWGERSARVKELPTGDETYSMMWWLVGRQNFVQVEVFQHMNPRERAKHSDWRPCDLGWVRFGVIVPDFDVTIERLHDRGLQALTSPTGTVGSRRVCFREPGADTIVEVMEHDAVLLTRGNPSSAEGPELAYIAASVSDLATARRYFGEALGLDEIEPDAIHRDGHEALWGLEGAQRTCAVFRGGDVLLEMVQYETPSPKAPAEDSLLSDLGIMNAAIGYRDRDELVRALAAVTDLGATSSTPAPDVSGSVYLRIFDRLSLELLLVPSGLDMAYGFKPLPAGASGNF